MNHGNLDLLNQPDLAWKPYLETKQPDFGIRQAAHLFRRAAFGGTIDEIDNAVAKGLESTINDLFAQIEDDSIDKEMETAARLVSGSADARQLAAWWLLRMVRTNSPFVEKVTLFWHGHFATGAEKVNNARAMFRQNQLLRKHAFGKFEPLVKDISSDVAMLVYLDSEENRRTRPNENYARELMELFCLGPGNYSEEDIKEIARCFTGWTIRKNQFRFNEHHHDKNTKAFLGVSGNYDGNDAVSIVLKQPAAPRFIAKKLIRYFVADEIELTDRFVQPVADRLRETDFDIRDTIRMILTSHVFYSPVAMGHKIKSPVELTVGFLRFFEATTNVTLLTNRIADLGQLPLYPPNVKGWNGGKTWINASTILGRANLTADILRHNKTKFADGSLKQWFNSQARLRGQSSEAIVETMASYLLATKLSESTAESIVGLANPADQPLESVSAMAALPEFQLN
ncbi:MAG: DUF1800 domain-containing protein [Planctomycetota bacterium]